MFLYIRVSTGFFTRDGGGGGGFGQCVLSHTDFTNTLL